MSLIKYITLEEELRKNPELKISDIHILREWCKKQPHLPKIQDVEFAIFLHSKYYHIEPTKRLIENYYTYRTHMQKLFSNRNIHKEKQLQNVLKTACLINVDDKTKEGYKIWVGRLIDTDPSHFSLNELLNVTLMMHDEFTWMHGSIVGQIIVIDGKGLTTKHVERFNITLLKNFILYVQDAAIVRIKGIHIINVLPIIQTLFNILKPFINAELINMTYFHSSLQSASQYFPIEALPNECGGKKGTAQELMNAQIKKVENFSEWYLNDEKYKRVNESMRIDKINTSSNLDSIEGSFKKLELD